MFAGPSEWGTGSSAYSITHATRTRLLYTYTYLFPITEKHPAADLPTPDNDQTTAADQQQQ